MRIVGVNAFHGDASAALLADGALVAGIEEERLCRIKHCAGFPSGAISSVIGIGSVSLEGVDHVAISRDPSAHLLAKVLSTIRRRPGLAAIRSRLENHARVRDLAGCLQAVPGARFTGTIHNVEHHRAHMASAFFCSPFDEAACLTVDGFGDFLSSMSAVGRHNRLEVIDGVLFPHSLGILYTAVTQFLGFPKYGDEYKVMGLAAYGRPSFRDKLRGLLRLKSDGRFELDPVYFNHAGEGVTMSWDSGEPVLGPLFSPRFADLFGPQRHPDSELTDRDRDLAASLQTVYEEAFFHRLRWLQKRTGLKTLCLAGGCAMNSVANGKIFRQTDFEGVFIQSAAGDAGTSLGAALYVWHQVLDHPRGFVMEHSYWGPEFDDSEIQAAIKERMPDFSGSSDTLCLGGTLRVRREPAVDALIHDTARAIAEGEIVGWFQGRTEWGPRALGNRSILADPRRADMKDILNARIKRREPFRPFAPSILEERLSDFFEESHPDPFMIKVYPIRPAKRPLIPAVTHVDGTGRLQTVSKSQNIRYWQLIKAFDALTGIPVLLNTSFNENEPIVNTPGEALDCFLRTRMDRLVLGDWILAREPSPPSLDGRSAFGGSQP
ncbi:MAG TPA: carbamoyltransferase C-terminal domain-containing protein [Planctomycetota bacterium]|nr:carbamoyltransferase C-terminal domain-containing protein [Planctomycetota bacterium]